MASDEEDFVFIGTAIEREEEVTTRRKKAIAEAAGNLRTLAPWKQEVLDEEGRRRFHGAFTGGYSAGYYNTVGSKEGWAPQTFTSSRKNRAEIKNQSVLNFLDEDEKSNFEGQHLGTSSKFDTFGFTAAEHARKQADKEQQQRPSAIPGPAPDEIVVPATESIGIKLLLKMGWRHGHSIKDLRASSKHDSRREARKAFLAFSSHGSDDQTNDKEPAEADPGSSLEQPINSDVPSSQKTPVFVTNPKQDLHGLGFDPFKHAPEFRENKRLRTTGNKEPGYQKTIRNTLFGLKSGKTAPGFGIGALEDYDAEDEDVYESGYNFEEIYIQEDEEPSMLSIESKPSKLSIDSKPSFVAKDPAVLPGFKVASHSDYQMERFEPPVIPKDFVPHHKFPPESENKFSVPPPPEFPPPDDNNRKLLIEGVSTLVARCGKLYEDLSREKNQSNPLFSFLSGGTGHEYYARKLWEEQQKRKDQPKLPLHTKSSKNEKMTAEDRGKLLGEKPLERTLVETKSSVTSSDIQLQFNLSDTFTTTAFNELAEVAKPFKNDPAKQERFEQFLKEKYRGGLRSTESGGTSHMSEAARARERLDFEAAAEALAKGKTRTESKPSGRDFMDLLANSGMQFTSGGMEQQGKDDETEDHIANKMYPKREEFQWRPSPIVCKRFDLTDPYMGKLPPPPRMRRKMDSLIFTSDTVKVKEGTVSANSDTKSDTLQLNKDEADKEIEVEVEVENVERPVDLYKAIFSDDSDDEAEAPVLNKTENPEKKIEVANATLNRLIAGDFLESLGKELGMELPSELPYSANNKTPAHDFQKETPPDNNPNVLSLDKNASSSPDPEPSRSRGLPHNQEVTPQSAAEKKSVHLESVDKKDRKSISVSRRSQNQSSNPLSEDEKSRKRSRRHHRYRSSDSFSDSSGDSRDQHHSRSKGRRKESSRDKSSSNRKHSKHRKRESRESDSKSRHGKREKRRERD